MPEGEFVEKVRKVIVEKAGGPPISTGMQKPGTKSAPGREAAGSTTSSQQAMGGSGAGLPPEIQQGIERLIQAATRYREIASKNPESPEAQAAQQEMINAMFDLMEALQALSQRLGATERQALQQAVQQALQQAMQQAPLQQMPMPLMPPMPQPKAPQQPPAAQPQPAPGMQAPQQMPTQQPMQKPQLPALGLRKPPEERKGALSPIELVKRVARKKIKEMPAATSTAKPAPQAPSVQPPPLGLQRLKWMHVPQTPTAQQQAPQQAPGAKMPPFGLQRRLAELAPSKPMQLQQPAARQALQQPQAQAQQQASQQPQPAQPQPAAKQAPRPGMPQPQAPVPKQAAQQPQLPRLPATQPPQAPMPTQRQAGAPQAPQQMPMQPQVPGAQQQPQLPRLPGAQPQQPGIRHQAPMPAPGLMPPQPQAPQQPPASKPPLAPHMPPLQKPQFTPSMPQLPEELKNLVLMTPYGPFVRITTVKIEFPTDEILSLRTRSATAKSSKLPLTKEEIEKTKEILSRYYGRKIKEIRSATQVSRVLGDEKFMRKLTPEERKLLENVYRVILAASEIEAMRTAAYRNVLQPPIFFKSPYMEDWLTLDYDKAAKTLAELHNNIRKLLSDEDVVYAYARRLAAEDNALEKFLKNEEVRKRYIEAAKKQLKNIASSKIIFMVPNFQPLDIAVEVLRSARASLWGRLENILREIQSLQQQNTATARAKVNRWLKEKEKIEKLINNLDRVLSALEKLKNPQPQPVPA